MVVFLTDQQRWDSAGLHGNPLDLTPNFDRLARAGTHLVNTFVSNPVCGPSRASLQTGLYPSSLGCFRNGIPLPSNVSTLATCFTEGGYATGYIGKWHLADPSSRGPVAVEGRGGYRQWLAANVLEFTSDAYRTELYDNEGRAVELPGYRVDALTDAAIRFVDSHKANPFLLFLSYLEPHHQNTRDDHPAPVGYRERYEGRWVPPDLAAFGGSSHRDLAGYWGMVRRLDEALGRLCDALLSLDLADNTIVLFTSDHGSHFKTRNDDYKRSCHDVSIRVPTAVWGPGFDGKGQVKHLVSSVDIAPTLLDAAGLPVPAEMEGRSLMPVLDGKVLDWPTDVMVQISESQLGRAIRTHRWKYSVRASDDDGTTRASADEYTEEFLYDLYSDPFEIVNLVGLESHRLVADVMRQRLLRRIEEIGEPAPVILPAPPRPGGQRSISPQEADL
ncbi:sulfatase-like hydrolase/transferase [Kribbella sp. CA-294648]|uniref:sulfatase-like hydrolase/transferase n=1 Tax=Kribbella sp. CA-294648 TaxID=3239948 RepID=UPI003D89BCBA